VSQFWWCVGNYRPDITLAFLRQRNGRGFVLLRNAMFIYRIMRKRLYGLYMYLTGCAGLSSIDMGVNERRNALKQCKGNRG
jgi:hypothetical protein